MDLSILTVTIPDHPEYRETDPTYLSYKAVHFVILVWPFTFQRIVSEENVERLVNAKKYLTNTYEKYMSDLSKRISTSTITAVVPPTIESAQSSLDSLPRTSTSEAPIPIQNVQPQDLFELFNGRSGFKILVIDIRDIPDFIDGHISWTRPSEEFIDIPAGAVIPIDSLYLRLER